MLRDARGRSPDARRRRVGLAPERPTALHRFRRWPHGSWISPSSRLRMKRGRTRSKPARGREHRADRVASSCAARPGRIAFAWSRIHGKGVASGIASRRTLGETGRPFSVRAACSIYANCSVDFTGGTGFGNGPMGHRSSSLGKFGPRPQTWHRSLHVACRALVVERTILARTNMQERLPSKTNWAPTCVVADRKVW